MNCVFRMTALMLHVGVWLSLLVARAHPPICAPQTCAVWSAQPVSLRVEPPLASLIAVDLDDVLAVIEIIVLVHKVVLVQVRARNDFVPSRLSRRRCLLLWRRRGLLTA